jgi:hypothetical protein
VKISNNTLAVLLSFALIISVFGTFASVYYIDSLNLLTGRATNDWGNVTLSVTGAVSCQTSDKAIAFGAMTRGSTNDSYGIGDYFTLNNNGNTLINVTVNATENLWDTAAYNPPSSYWQIKCNNTQTGSCATTSYANVPALITAVEVVTNLQSADGSDNVTIAVNVTVPNDEPTGSKSGQVTFWCSQTA